jgi:hypothetical protein
MDQSFSLTELEFLYSITHQCLFLNNHQLDNDAAITADTRNSIVDENKVAMKCLRKLRSAISDVSPATLKALDSALPPLR